MKTIQEIAEEIGVSKSTLQKRMSREPLCTYIQTHIRTKGRTKYVDEAGEILIKYAFSKSVSIDKIADKKANVHSQIITILHEQLKVKDKQIDEQQQTIKELTAILKVGREKARPKPQKRKFKNALPEIKNMGVKRLMKSSK